MIRKIYRVLGAHGFAPSLAKTQIVPLRVQKIVFSLFAKTSLTIGSSSARFAVAKMPRAK